jgi:hypothetical protein
MSARKKNETRGRILSSTLAKEKQEAFLKTYSAAYESNWAALQPRLIEEGLEAEEIQKLELVYHLADITGNNDTLVTSLQNKVNSVRDMALTFDRKKIQSLITDEHLWEDLPGDTLEEKRDYYIHSIEKQLFHKEPSAVITRMLKNAELPIKGKGISKGVLSFFEQHPDFNIRKTSVYTAVKQQEASLAKVDPLQRSEVMSTLKNIQRISSLSDSPALLPKMMEANLTSAHKIVAQPQPAFVKTYAEQLGGEEVANQVYEQAANINTRNEFLLTALRDKVTGLSVAAIDGKGGKQEAVTILQELAEQNNVVLNWEALFGNADMCECDECRSVYSASAYLVELLEYLRNNNVPSTVDYPNALDKLLKRRPDIGNLQLTCENANTALPYIDIVNEIMESFVEHLPAYQSEGNVQLDAFNVKDETSEELLANPQHINYNAYKILNNAVYPFTLPYNQPLDAIRLLLQKMGTSRQEIMDVFQMPKTINDSNVMNTARLAEIMQISREEFISLTKEDFYPKAYYDQNGQQLTTEAYQAMIGVKPVWQYYGFNSEAELLSQLKMVKSSFLPRTGISFKDLVAILETKSVNTFRPQGAALAMLNRIPYEYRYLQSLVVNATDPSVKYAQVISLLQNAFQNPDDKTAVRNWVLQHFEKTGKMIVLELGGTTPGQYGDYYYYGGPSANLWQVAQANDISNANLQHLDGTPLTVAEYDTMQRFIRLWRKLAWSIPQTDMALGALSPVGSIRYDITPVIIQQLSWVKQLIDHMGLPLERLLVCCADMQMYNEHSLYQQLFLKPNILSVDPVFKADANGNYLSGSYTITDHLAGLMAALQLTADEIKLIRTRTAIPDVLSFANVSVLFRYGLLARYLKLPVKRVLDLKDLFGNPFQNANTTYDFIILCEEMQAAKFRPEQLNYMISNVAEPGIAPAEKSVLTIARSLYEGLRAIDVQFTEQSTVTAELLQQQLRLIFKEEMVSKIMEFLDGTAVFTVNVTPGLSISFPDSVAGRFTYDKVKGLLSVIGILSQQQWNEVINMSKDESVKSALRNLAAQPGTFIDDTLFAFIPPGSTARQILLEGGPELPTVDGKIAACYKQFMPFVKKQRAQQLIVEKLSQGLQTDEAITGWLLTTALTGADGVKPLIADIEKIGQPFATGTTWEGYISPAADDTYTFLITAQQSPSIWLDEQVITVQPVSGVTGQFEVAPLKLKAGVLYKLKVTGLNGDLSSLSWKTPTVPKMQVPASCFFPAVANDTFKAAYRKLHKAALFINGFALTAEELTQLYICKDGFLGMNLNVITLPLWRRFREYTVVRNRHKNGSLSLAAFLVWARSLVFTQLLEKIVALTGWVPARVQLLINSDQFGFNSAGSYRNEKNLDKMYRALSLADATGIETGKLFTWAAPVYDFNKCYEVAASIRSSMRAAYNQQDWQQLIKPVNDKLRVNQRNALISFLLVQPALKQWAEARSMALDANALFDFFLIDVQMESVMETSRIRQALSSVQTFVQRCFMGLEKDIPTNMLDRSRWEWMQQYRTWEANRKVFLYPENWIEPNLRDSKSPFFLELEAELLQQDISPENVENAVRNYLNKVHEVGNLDICAVHQEGTYLRTNHIFARSRNIPYTYYYRKFNSDFHLWSPWEKIETDIQVVQEDADMFPPPDPQNGNYLVPVVWKNRLLLFWPVITKKTFENRIGDTPVSKISIADQSNKKPEEIQPLQYREISLAWSEYKDGKWTAKETSSCVITTPPKKYSIQASHLFFIPELQAEQVKIFVNYHDTDSNQEMKSAGAFTFNDGNSIGKTTGETYSAWQHHPANTISNFMQFHSLGTVPAVYATMYGDLIFNKPFADYKLIRTLQKDTRNNYDFSYVTLIYQEKHTDNSHNRTLIGYNFYSHRDFENFYHPYTGTFLQQLNQNGLPGLLSTLTQQNRQFAITKEAYNAVNIVQWPDGGVDFGKDTYNNMFGESYSTYSIYNWELFFHIPLLIADKLSKCRQYEQARNWFHYIFNPLAKGPEADVKRYWQFLPFKTSKVDSIASIFYNLYPSNSNSDIIAWRNNPFNPHLIARTRPAAYMKTVVMKYLDNLIAWGDELYRQNTMETINQALMMYVTAGHILGPRPQVIPERGRVSFQTYNSLKNKWDAFGNALVEMELAFPYSGQVVYEGGDQHGKPYRGNNIFGFGASLYFGIPNNPKLLQYWDTVGDRLFKIRHSMNIDGVVQKLALFEPPIDPALLVQAAANGISLSSVLNDFNVSMPFYRFNYLAGKAQEMCGEVKALGNQLLSVIERRDAEALSRLRSTQEINLVNAVKAVKTNQLEDARLQVEILNKTRENTGKRLKHYQRLLGLETAEVGDSYIEVNGLYHTPVENSELKLIDWEREDMSKALEAAQKQTLAGAMEAAAGLAHYIPNMTINGEPLGIGVSVTIGGNDIGAALTAGARVIQTVSNRLQYESGAAAKKTSFLRQRQDWILQANTAGNELGQIDKQIIAAKIRIAIAEKELANQQIQIDQAKEMHDYLITKYTNQELYQWMEGQVRTIYRQAYQLAYDMARKAEKAYRFEKGETNTDFIKLAYWNGQRDGLLAGEQLSLAIRQMETAYQDKNKRDYEITKHISLAQIDPYALISLKETGTCELQLPEELFDLDFPGHYMRRIKSMSVSIPCIAGPYTSVSATLTLLHDKTRIKPLTGTQYGDDGEGTDDRFVNKFGMLQSIATSNAQNDSGLFELNFRDERYLPFEGAGAVSRWRLELPAEFRQFDYDTIPDVIFHMQYTAREGGGMLKQAAIDNLNDYVESAEENGLMRLFNLRHEFSTEWYRLQHPENDSAVLSIKGLEDRLPFITRSKNVQSKEVTGIQLFVRGTINQVKLNDKPFGSGINKDGITQFTLDGGFPGFSQIWNFSFGNGSAPTEAALQDAWLVVSYSLTMKP